MLQEPSKELEERFYDEAMQLVEKLVDDFAHLFARYGRPVEARDDLEKGEIAGELCVLLERFYEPVDHTKRLEEQRRPESS